MNAAAKTLSQTTIFNGHFTDMRLSRPFFLQFILLIAVLISALGVIYVTNLYRVTFTQLQMADQTSHQLQLQWGQLLLEHASLSMPARVQAIANQKLKMVLPAEKRALVLRVK